MTPRHGLTTRAVLITCAVAVISVLVTALVAMPLAVRYAQADAKAALAAETTFVADWLNQARGGPLDERLVRRMRARGIDVYLIRGGVADQPGLPTALVRAVAEGQSVTGRAIRLAGRPMLADGRPLAQPGDGVVLVQPALVGAARQVLNRLWLALFAGLAAGLAAGILLARRLVRPLREAAAAARRLSGGDRSVRLAVEPPAELADLSRALNDLAAALSTSEGRQRDFLLSVSHELRTPLTTIRGYAEALADGVIAPESATVAGRTVLGEADRLDRLVTDLLALARAEAAEFPVELLPVDLAVLVGAAAAAWAPRCAEAGVQLRTELVPESAMATTDPGRIRQVVDILVENALRVVPAGSPLVLVAGPGPVVEVRDGGPGLADEDLAVAFDQGVLYERYRAVRKVGTGLGLALAARLVRRLGGEITAGHAPEGGARFTVRLA